MGKRESMTAFESIVHDLYARKLLTRAVLVSVWQHMDNYLEMDVGGYGAEETEGKTMPEIVCEILGVSLDGWKFDDSRQADIDEGFETKQSAYFWDVLYYKNNWADDTYPATQCACPRCHSDDIDEDVTYPEAQGLWSDGAGGYVDCTCNACGFYWTRDFGEDDIPDMEP